MSLSLEKRGGEEKPKLSSAVKILLIVLPSPSGWCSSPRVLLTENDLPSSLLQPLLFPERDVGDRLASEARPSLAASGASLPNLRVRRLEAFFCLLDSAGGLVLRGKVRGMSGEDKNADDDAPVGVSAI